MHMTTPSCAVAQAVSVELGIAVRPSHRRNLGPARRCTAPRGAADISRRSGSPQAPIRRVAGIVRPGPSATSFLERAAPAAAPCSVLQDRPSPGGLPGQ